MRCGITFAARQLPGHCGRRGLSGREQKEGKRRNVIGRHGRAKGTIGITHTKKYFLISKFFSFRDLAKCPILRVREIYERKKALQTLNSIPALPISLFPCS